MSDSHAERSHPLVQEPVSLDEELSRLPEPPNGLPRPWKATRWKQAYMLGYFLALFGLWGGARLLNIHFLGLDSSAASWAVVSGIWLFLGLGMINIYHLRIYFRDYYRWGGNRQLGRGLTRYRRRGEALFELFARYRVGDGVRYFTFYVPGAGPALTRQLAAGAEPLLFDAEGQWLDDEPLFHKALLMWSQALDLSPGTLENKIAKDHKGLAKLIVRYLPPLPGLLDQNAATFERRGLGAELALVRQGYPAKCAYFRHSLHVLQRKVEWGDAYGWDSLTELRYEDMLRLHEAKASAFESRRLFLERHHLNEVEAAADKLQGIVARERSGPWVERKALKGGLQVLAAPHPTGEIHFEKVEGEWRAPEVMLQAYRSRVAYAREVNAKRATARKV